MEARFEREEIQRELKRVQRDIQAIKDERELESGARDGEDKGEDAGEALLQELLKTSEAELLDQNGKTRWDLPLPVPPELETEERLDELLQVSEEIFGSLKLNAVKRGEAGSNAWELSGSAGPVEFKVAFQTKVEGKRTIVRNFELKKIPHECVQELNPLIELAKARSCVRTWLVGLSEYAFLVQERELAFSDIRTQTPYGSCRPPERRVQTFIEAVSDDVKRAIRLFWRADWTVMPEPDEPNEFLLPRCELMAVRGFDDAGKAVIEDPDAFSGLVRKHGIVSAMVLLVKRMYD